MFRRGITSAVFHVEYVLCARARARFPAKRTSGKYPRDFCERQMRCESVASPDFPAAVHRGISQSSERKTRAAAAVVTIEEYRVAKNISAVRCLFVSRARAVAILIITDYYEFTHISSSLEEMTTQTDSEKYIINIRFVSTGNGKSIWLLDDTRRDLNISRLTFRNSRGRVARAFLNHHDRALLVGLRAQLNNQFPP